LEDIRHSILVKEEHNWRLRSRKTTPCSSIISKITGKTPIVYGKYKMRKEGE
jgi:hypothetical protein